MRALKMRSIVSSHWKLTVTNWEQSLKLILSTTQEVAEELIVDHSMVVWLLKPIGRVKKLDKCVPHELIENKKIVLLKHCLLLLYTTTTNHFSIRLWRVTKRDFMQPVISSSMVGLRRSFKAIPKATLAPQEGHGHYLVVCCWCDPLQLSESQQKHYIWELCLANWWNAPKSACLQPVLVNRCWAQQGPSFTSWQPLTVRHTTSAPKVEWIGLQNFVSSAIFTWPLASWLPLLQASWQLFAEKMLPQTAGGRKCFSRVCKIPKHRFLCYMNKQTYFLLTKMCWLSWFLFWLIKMCLNLVISSVQSFSHVQLFVTPWTAACQASLSITNSWSLLKLMSIELMMPSNHLILFSPFFSRLQYFPASGSFPMSHLCIR